MDIIKICYKVHILVDYFYLLSDFAYKKGCNENIGKFSGLGFPSKMKNKFELYVPFAGRSFEFKQTASDPLKRRFDIDPESFNLNNQKYKCYVHDDDDSESQRYNGIMEFNRGNGFLFLSFPHFLNSNEEFIDKVNIIFL